MSILLHNLVERSADINPGKEALIFKNMEMSYVELAQHIEKVARSLNFLGLSRYERVAVYLPKRFETVISFFSISKAGGVFVPVNPILKAQQVIHILRDCNARILITSKMRFEELEVELARCHDLQTVILIDIDETLVKHVSTINIVAWQNLLIATDKEIQRNTIDTDMAAILYTSGSTGKPKGVVLSHRNMVTGAHSVAQYLDNQAEDRLLAVLPFSFDYGFSQLSTAFSAGATIVLMDYLFPQDVIKIVSQKQITGLAAVPPLWIQLAQLPWPEEAQNSLRYITNSGGAMPVTTLKRLQTALPRTLIFLMYGLTEAFRSTYLPPEELERRPESMGKAIPNAEILVVREDGSLCAPGEPGELVHRGSLVAMGYWNDPEKTAVRFKSVPYQEQGLPLHEIAVWSGDTVKMDEEGYLYFVSRKDEMIKTSGYRVSPTEVEEIIYQSGMVGEVVALGIQHPILGQAIVAVITTATDKPFDSDLLQTECVKKLPPYMVPALIIERRSLPRNPNGKIDRKLLATEFSDYFNEKITPNDI